MKHIKQRTTKGSMLVLAIVYPRNDLGKSELEDVLFEGLVWQVGFHLKWASRGCEQSGHFITGISMKTKK